MAKRAKGKQQPILGKDAFLRQNSLLKRELLELEELGGSVWVQELSGRRLLEYSERIEAMQKDGDELTPAQSLDLMALLVSQTVVNADGSPMFTEDEARELTNGSLTVLKSLSQKAMEVSGLDKAVAKGVADNLPNVSDSSTTA